ncbi:MAG: cyclic nucleotide-binding domain-containing protein [Alphaproteobacteria bacterium]|nr:MAG: cyclic nucleotide-binding domain-containing protein [Alphaproteobacteria bacterium]
MIFSRRREFYVNHVAASTTNLVVEIASRLNFFTPHQRARLVTIGEEVHFSPHEKIVISGTPSHAFYIILTGTVSITASPETKDAHAGDIVGYEPLIDVETVISTVTAETQVVALRIAGNEYRNAFGHSEREYVKVPFLQSLVLGKKFDPTLFHDLSSPETSLRDVLMHIGGWAFALMAPLFLYFSGILSAFSAQAQMFMSVMLMLTCVTALRLLSDYVGVTMALFILISGGIINTRTLLSGFNSPTFIICISLFALTLFIAQSGIIYRLIVKALMWAPNNLLSYNFLLVISGGILTLGIPNLRIRTELAKATILDTQNLCRSTDNTLINTSLLFSGYFGIYAFMSSTLSASLIHFLVLDLFWGQYNTQYGWWGWAVTALPSTLVLFVGYFLYMVLFISRKPHVVFSIKKAKNIQKILGKTTFSERTAITFMLFSIIAIATYQIHYIPPLVPALLILLLLLVSGMMATRQFRKNIQWDYIMYLAGLIGLSATTQALEIDQWITQSAKPMFSFVQQNFSLFATCLIGIVAVTRLFIPRDMTMYGYCIILIPLSQSIGINPWVITFIIISASRLWFFIYQEPEVEYLYTSVNSIMPLKRGYFFISHMFLNFLNILGIYVGIYTWQVMGIL